MKVHLVLIYLPLVENLVDKDEQPMGVALYGLYIPLVLLILRNILFQLLQRTMISVRGDLISCVASMRKRIFDSSNSVLLRLR